MSRCRCVVLAGRGRHWMTTRGCGGEWLAPGVRVVGCFKKARHATASAIAYKKKHKGESVGVRCE